MNEAPYRCFTLGQASGLTSKHQIRLERLARVKHSSLLRKSVNYGQAQGPRLIYLYLTKTPYRLECLLLSPCSMTVNKRFVRDRHSILVWPTRNTYKMTMSPKHNVISLFWENLTLFKISQSVSHQQTLSSQPNIRRKLWSPPEWTTSWVGSQTYPKIREH